MLLNIIIIIVIIIRLNWLRTVACTLWLYQTI